MSQTSSKSLLNIALSSRSLYCLSRSLIYRVLHFTFNRSRRDVNRRLINQLLADDVLSAKVREIRIHWAPSAKLSPGEGSKADLELLGQALPRLNGLKTFIWDAQYPILSWLLKALEREQPRCVLYIRHPPSQDSAQTLPRLCGSPRLFALAVTITTGQFQAFRDLQNVIYSAPNLQDLTIVSTFNSTQSSSYQEQGQSEPLSLRSLELCGRIFDTFKLPVVWSMLERLSIGSLSYLPSLIPDFSGLKSLQLRVRNSDESVLLGVVLKGCKKLEVLDLAGCISSIQTAEEGFWESIGKTLIKLRLHEEEALNRAREGALLSPTVMECVAIHCRKLRSLGLSLECDGQEWVSLNPCIVAPSNITLKISTAIYNAQIYLG